MDIEFKFKGNRKYVHGPDIFYAVSKYIYSVESEKPESIKIVSKQLSDKQLFISNNILENNPIQSIAEYSINGEKRKLYIYENSEFVNKNIDYDEPDIVANSEISDLKGEISKYSRYSIAEISVALLKEICVVSISDNVKWVFVGLELMTNIEKFTDKLITVKLLKNLGTKMVVSDIYIDSEKVGQLKFSSLPI